MQQIFFPSNAISSWNYITTNFQGNITKNSIKSHILKTIRPFSKSVYNIHDPIGIRYLFQLTTGLSPLRSHKYRHNFLDTPTDNCICNQGIENTSHFLFECLQFAIPRIDLAVDITNILRQYNLLNLANSVDFYLYGHSDLTLDENRQILTSTINYIKKTERFDQ